MEHVVLCLIFLGLLWFFGRVCVMDPERELHGKVQVGSYFGAST